MVFARPIVAVNLSVLHDEFDAHHHGRIQQGIAVHGDDIGEIARLNRAGFAVEAHKNGCFQCGRPDRFQRFHAPLRHGRELFRIVSVRINAGVGSKRHSSAGNTSPAKIGPLQFAKRSLFFHHFRQHPNLQSFRQNVVVVINIEDQERAVLLGQRDSFVVDQTGIFHRIDARRGSNS